jgi:hypothetical protein
MGELIAALVSAFIAVVTLGITIWQRLILRRDRESKQAVLVAAWVSGSPIGFPNPDETLPTKTVEVSVVNGSPQPIGRIQFQVTCGSSRRQASILSIPPNGAIKAKKVVFPAISFEDVNATNQLDIWFTDEAGRQWQRLNGDQLRPGVPPIDWSELRMSIGPQPNSDQSTIQVRVEEFRG